MSSADNKNLRIGQKVEVSGKNVHGTIAYVGMTTFAVGKWVGVVFDEPVGKNNGSLKGTVYFTCPENHGMFVRPSQITLLDEAGNPIMETSVEDKQPRSRLSSVGSVRSVASAPRLTTVRRKSPVKSPHSIKQSLNLSSSNSSSRLSLAGSRQSLMGSRSQLASPATERPVTAQSLVGEARTDKKPVSASVSPPETSAATPKRESFVETGFLETLKPQFTAGYSLTTPLTATGATTTTTTTTTDDKLLALQHQQAADELRAQVNDLTEKLDTLKQRRNEDKERLREFDKMKTQYDQLQEFKAKIMDAQSLLQRELQRSRQETKDAIEARDQHIEEMSELAENAEMITLDKEMAEEKADTLQLELEAARERCEELQLDLDILKAEMQNKASVIMSGSGTLTGTGETTSGVGLSSFEFKQMEQQNARLRETLVRLRDLTAHDKHEIQKISKELDTSKSELTELHRTKEKLSAKIDDLEMQVVDLQEQVDAALGAEEMVEQLADKKMELEDRVKLLEEEVHELEALEEVHELLVEGNRELELDLREELDMTLAAKREMIREKDAALETILDRDQTILKFRELVQKLNDQIQAMNDHQLSATELDASAAANKQSHQEAMVDAIDFKKMFAESKAYTRAIDLQIRQIELGQSNEQVRLLTAYMPDTFMCRGSDHDAILVILLVARIVYKSEIIVSQARERFSPVELIDRNAVLQAHAVDQFVFKARLLYHVHNLQAVMHQFMYGLKSCTPETLLKAGAAIPEMMAQEKIVDGVVELLKANQLDENSSTDNLEKCVAFFNAMYSVLLTGENLINETQLLRDCTASLTSACDSIVTDSLRIQALIQGGDETSESGILMQFVVQNGESLKQHLKLVKRRLPQDATVIKIGLAEKTLSNLRQTTDLFGKSMSAMVLTTKLVLQMIATSDDIDATVSNAKLLDFLGASFERVYEQDDRGPSQNLRTMLETTNIEIAQIAQYLLDKDCDVMAGVQKVQPTPPIVLRAQHVKKQLEETKTLTANLENREAEIRQLKLSAKMKQSELSEMQVRKDLAEKKLSVLQNDHEVNTEKLQRKCDEMDQLLKKKEKEFEETMDHLQTDIDSLESERGALREKLKGYSSKKGDLKASTAFDITASSPYIVQELSLLKKAFNDERNERIKLQAAEMKKILSRLAPIYVPKPKDERIAVLEKDLSKAKYDYLMSLATGAELPPRASTHANLTKMLNDRKASQTTARHEIKSRVESLATTVLNEYLQRKPHRAANADFSQFPSVELARALKS